MTLASLGEAQASRKAAQAASNQAKVEVQGLVMIVLRQFGSAGRGAGFLHARYMQRQNGGAADLEQGVHYCSVLL
jgi:hypothetical protein